MRWIHPSAAVLALLAASATLRAEAPPRVTPPVLVAHHVEAPPSLERGSEPYLAAWAGSSMLPLPTTGSYGAPVRVRACATDQALFLELRWGELAGSNSPPAPSKAAMAEGDSVRAVFASSVSDDGQPVGPDPDHAVVFEAGTEVSGSATPPAGIRDGGWWVVRLECPRNVARGGLQLTTVDGRGGRSVTPWTRLVFGGAPTLRDFQQDKLGKPAAGMTPALAGAGKPGEWVVRERKGVRCLVQESADETDARFPLALLDGFAARDVDLSVAFKDLDGFKDRAAGLVWRVKDAGNHYILRANALEKNVVLYKMQDNLRVDLPPVGREADYGVKVDFGAGEWNVLRVVAVGSRFQAYLDGRLLFDVVDATFPEAGGVGLWTKSDSVTAFDDLCAVDLAASNPAPKTPAAPSAPSAPAR